MSLVLLWGTSFMFTSIAVRSVDPLSLVFFRVLIGALIVTAYMYGRNRRLPFDLRSWLIFSLYGFVGNLFPFFLIAWGQQTLDSGLAGMIMAIMPLMTMILAHYFIPQESLNRFKIIGFILGITGVTLLLGPVFTSESREILSAIAVFIAACSYALNTILVRRLPAFNPMVAGAGVLIAATFCLLPIWLAQQHVEWSKISSASLWSLIWLGIAPTGIASIILFAVIERAGPTFLSTINYLIPVVAFLAGVWVLSEPMNMSSLFSLAIILLGIALTRFKAEHNSRVKN